MVIKGYSVREYYKNVGKFKTQKRGIFMTAKEVETGREIRIVDTTLRDGEQTAGVVFSNVEKITIAEMLSDLGVDQLEVGIPTMGGDEKQAIKEIVNRNLKRATPSQLPMKPQTRPSFWYLQTGARSTRRDVRNLRTQRHPCWATTSPPSWRWRRASRSWLYACPAITGEVSCLSLRTAKWRRSPCLLTRRRPTGGG